MDLVITRLENVSTVELRGRIDSGTAKQFGDCLSELIQSGANRIVIDLANIAYISSAGFRALLIAGKLVEETGGRLALCGVAGEVKRLFDLASFTDLFLICATRDDCVAKVQASE